MAADDLTELPITELFRRTVALARSEPVLQSDEYWTHVRALRVRSGKGVFEEAVRLCSDPDGLSRAAGADILAQLGVRDGVFPFADESEGPLVGLLEDSEPRVIASALCALGHLDRGDPAQFAQLSKHASEDVRYALAHALGGRTDDVSTATLVELSRDVDRDTRDWATFALAELTEDDSPAVRDALAARLVDKDDDVRAEAIAGLARRHDERAVQPLIQELSHPDVGTILIEAAAAMPRPEFISSLDALHAARPDDSAIDEALKRCHEAMESM